MNKCRACLKGEDPGKMCKLDENLIKCFNMLTSLNVKLNDFMPQQICECCLGMVNMFVEFRDKCINANSILLDVDISKNIKIEEITSYPIDIKAENIKQEDHNYELDILTGDNSLNNEIDDNFTYELISNNKTCREGDNTSLKRQNNKSSTAIYSCGLCVKEFNDKSLMLPHLNQHKIDSECICSLCMQKFSDWHQLFSHRLQHLTNKNEKECHICFAKFTSPPYLEYHYKKLHSMIDNPILQCLPCKESFTTPQQLRYHIAKLHLAKINISSQRFSNESKFKNQNNKEGDRNGYTHTRINVKYATDSTKPMFECESCNKSYTTSLKIRKHIRRIHSENIYICDYCSKEYSYKDQLKNHIQRHISLKIYYCDECDYHSSYSTNLKFHKIRRHTTIKVYCKVCSRVFSDQLKLDAHKCQIKSVICSTCGKSFKTNKLLNRHMASHSSEARFACARCPARYRSRAALTAHRNRHDGVRPHACARCPAAFYSPSVLTKHMRTHTGIKPYVCKICQKAFTGNNNLKVHMRVHGEYLIKKKVKNEEEKLQS